MKLNVLNMNPIRLLLLSLAVCMTGPAFALPYFGRTPGNKLTAMDAQDDDEFGRSVAAAGDNFLFGAPDEDGAGAGRGAAYLFNAVSGAQLRKFTPSETADEDAFGIGVALTAHHAVVGAPSKDEGGNNRGAVFVFDLENGEEIHKLTPSVVEDLSGFGFSLAASGNLLIVGSLFEDDSGTDRGAAYVFDLTTGAEKFRLTASDGADNDSFGTDVALVGNLAVVGAPGQNGLRGAVYVFDLSTGAQVFKFAPTDLAALDRFGISVGASGSSLIVGAISQSGGGNFRGAAYVFDLVTGTQKYKLTASDAADGDQLGTDVAISGNLALASTPFKNGGIGAVYVYDLATGGQLAKLVSPDAVPNGMGVSIALDGTRAVVGANSDPGGGLGRGATYVFEIPDRQPDLFSGSAPNSGVGRNVRNTSASGQTAVFTSRKLAQVSGYITVTNSGDTGDDFDLFATAGTADFSVTYLRRTGAAESNITAALIAGTHQEPNVVPDDAGRFIRVAVKPSGRLKKNKKGKITYLRRTFVARITAASATHDFKADAAAVQVQTR